MRRKVGTIFLTFSSLVLLGSFVALLYVNLKFPIYFKTEIQTSAAQHQVKPEIVASLISVESSYRKNIVSAKGAVGLMQVLPSTAEWVAKRLVLENYTEQDLFTPQINIEIGTYYLKYLLNKFDSLDLAICAYNAGEGVVNGWLKVQSLSTDGKTLLSIPYPETAAHLEKFKTAMQFYKYKFPAWN